MSLYLGTDRIDAGSAVSSDNKSITTNSLAQIQAVGVIDNNNSSTAIKTWTGTLNEYNALGTYNPDWLYYITDDITSEGIAPSPTGSIIAFGGSTAPNGWLICNGGEISRSTYSLLFSVIGTTYGAGDGSTTFNLPNGKVPLGVSAPVTLQKDGHLQINGTGMGDATLWMAGNETPYGGSRHPILATSGYTAGLEIDYAGGLKGVADLTNATAASITIIKY